MMNENLQDKVLENTMKCGMKAKLIAYRNANHVDIQFEDGTMVNNKKYQRFLDGTIGYPKTSHLEETKMMKCGLFATIIKYRNRKDIDVRFEDGLVHKHTQYRYFCRQSIPHEVNKKITIRSISVDPTTKDWTVTLQQNDERLQESIVIPYENTIGIVDPVSEELIHIDLLRQFQKQYFSNISVDFQQLQTYLKHLGIEKISLDGYSYNCFYMDTKIFRFTFKDQSTQDISRLSQRYKHMQRYASNSPHTTQEDLQHILEQRFLGQTKDTDYGTCTVVACDYPSQTLTMKWDKGMSLQTGVRNWSQRNNHTPERKSWIGLKQQTKHGLATIIAAKENNDKRKFLTVEFEKGGITNVSPLDWLANNFKHPSVNDVKLNYLNYIGQKIQLKSGLFVKITNSNIDDIYQQKTNKLELYGHFTIDNTPCKFTELYKLDKQPNKAHPTIIFYGPSTHGTVFQYMHIENIAYTMGQENYYECICEKCGLHTILSETQLQQHVAMHYQQTQPAFAYLS